MSEITKEEGTQKVSRRQIISDLAKATFGLAAGVAVVSATKVQAEPSGAPQEQLPQSLSKQIPQDQMVLRMQRELYTAMQKPVDQRQWAMVIDQRKCVGCSSCTVGCKAENKLPPGVIYRPVIEEEYGTFPNVARRFLPRPCMHCTNSPCTKVCPVGATYKREDGIVSIDYDKCIGCRYCISACPYGARTFDWGDYYTEGTPELQKYELEPAFEYGEKRARTKNESPINNTRKCHFCLHRLNAGMLPMCVTTCIGRATYFGDKSNPESLVSELIGSSRVLRLKEELGTEPNVYYLL
ncbi:(4Fe-4S)-binding protein [Desulfosporosinus sp. HMP52]|uniref:4Fe-4S dicluster domain-containing protein n=1 Tax=Desulfosporosinus TaxID=79206 RepID=UPI00051FA632|nr:MULTISPECIES: 4Fe-4S dicluster domain-containing protein [Desulfosporosinus]KGK91821.1 (4Fe-4S)-binding protein [Desulfosporosinus sp. HMP52]MCO1600212.1 4Fe-4S dicluster domain-containing protein [Desulfosporosinus nitroreducens]